jgi:hypothetical protein
MLHEYRQDRPPVIRKYPQNIEKGRGQFAKISRQGKLCSGSGSFWGSQIRIHRSEVRIRIRILPSLTKNSKKNFISTVLWLPRDFSFEEWNVPSKNTVISVKKTRKKIFFVGVLKVTDEKSRIRSRIRQSEIWIEDHWRKEKDQEPDTLIRGTDPWFRIRIRTKMSRIQNTVRKVNKIPLPGPKPSTGKVDWHNNIPVMIRTVCDKSWLNKVFLRSDNLKRDKCLHHSKKARNTITK